MAQDRSLRYRFESGWEHMPNALYDVDDKGYKSHTQFNYRYDNPPAVVAYVQTRTGGESIQVRVQDVTVTGCRIFYQEPDHDSGGGDLGDHNDEEITYLVMETGVWDHPSLGMMQAGTATHTGATAWESVTFTEAFDSTPAVFALLNTYNNGKFNSVRVRNVTTTGFEIRQYELKTLTSESVGWIAFERGSTAILEGNRVEINSVNTGANFGPDDSPYNITYTYSYVTDPFCLVCGNTSAGEQWWARAASAPTSSTHGVYAEEDQVSDSERSHGAETISWFIVAGLFAAQEKYESPALYRNVWTTDQYIYHTSTFSVDVYNSTASTRLAQLEAPSQETELRLPIEVDVYQTRDNVPMSVTISGTSHPVYTYSTDGNDLHFEDEDGNELGFWISSWTWQGVSEMQVMSPASGTNIYLLFNHSANVNYGHGAEEDVLLFYDDFTVTYETPTGLSESWVPSHTSDFSVAGEQLFCTSLSASYTWVDLIGYNFDLPVHIETKLVGISAGGGGVFSAFSHYLYRGTTRRGWHWFTDGSYDRSMYFDTGQQYWNGTGTGMNNSDTILHTYLYEDSVRIVADRASNAFDETLAGTTTGPFDMIRLAMNYSSSYSIDYVKVQASSDASGTVSSGTPTQLIYPIISFPSSVWANDDTVYISTTANGVYTVPVSSISGASTTITGTSFKKWPEITSDEVVYVHGADDYFCISTAEGVDRFTLSSGTRIYTEQENIHKCHQTASGTLYYIEMNPFYGVDETPTGLGRPLREWAYYQVLNFPGARLNNSQIRVTLAPDFPYHLLKPGGDDIRFIDGEGNTLKYYIESYYPTGSIMVKIPLAGTRSIYMLYGNPNATAQSNEDEVHYFFEDFSVLDTDVWSVYKGHSNNYAVITDGYLNMYDYNNSGVTVITKERLPYSMHVKARVRRNGGSSATQFDGIYGYSSTFNGRGSFNDGQVKIDPTDSGDETKHRLYGYNQNNHGTKSMSTSWRTWEGIWTDGYQYSKYDGEELELSTSYSLYQGSNYFCFHINNSSTNPNLNVDWMSMDVWPIPETITGETLDLWDLVHPKLHAVYNPTSNWLSADHVYEEFYGSPQYLNDIYVSQGTSTTNDNTIFLATDRGAHVIDERQGDEENATLKRYYIA